MVGEIGGDEEEKAARSSTRTCRSRSRVHRRLHRPAGQDNGPRRRDHLRLLRDRAGQEGSARGGGSRSARRRPRWRNWSPRRQAQLSELLVLFDIDGTLFLTSDPLVGRATLDAIREVWELDIPADAIGKVDHPGQTAQRITRPCWRPPAWTTSTSTPAFLAGASASPGATSSCWLTRTRPTGKPHPVRRRRWRRCRNVPGSCS